MTRLWCAPLLCVLLAFPASGSADGPDAAVRTSFTLLLGFPFSPEEAGKRAQLVPGTLIPVDVPATGTEESNRRQVLDRSVAFNRTAEKLWDTFRLDPGRRRQKSQVADAFPGKQLDLLVLDDGGVRVYATLISFTEKAATFRIVFRQADKALADSTIVAARGGRAVVGAMDGAAAPYIFLFVEPDPPGVAGSSSSKDITQPVLISKVDPVYPPEAKNEHVEGTVVLEGIVGTDGSISDIRALQDPDQRLTRAAIEALKQWRMQPAQRKDGTPVAARMAVTINFRLK